MKQSLYFFLNEQNVGIVKSQIPVLLIIVFLELISWFMLGGPPNTLTSFTSLIFLAAISHSALKGGIRAGFLTALISLIYFLYFIYVTTLNEPYLERLSQIGRSFFILSVAYLGVAFIIGRLSNKIKEHLHNEKVAREEVERERAKLETIVSQMPSGVIVAEAPSGKIILSNKFAQDLLGIESLKAENIKDYSGKQKAVRLSDGIIYGDDDWPLARSLMYGERVFSEEASIRRRDGREIIISINSSPIIRNGKIISAVVMFSDITFQKKQEERKDEFISMASHELKTPITSLKILNDVLKKTSNGDSEKVPSVIDKMDKQLDRLNKLVFDLLDISRIQTGKFEFNYESFDFDSFIKQIIDDLRPISEAHKLIIKGKSNKIVSADKIRIEQVLINLITNAVKFSQKADKIIINLSASEREVKVCVEDFGIGIEPDHQKRIFERFYQIDGLEQKTFPGLGIGLYISAQIIKRHGGNISVESKEKKGSIFCFSLPIESENPL